MKITGTREGIEEYVSKVNSAKGKTVATCEYVRGTDHGSVSVIYSDMELIQWMIDQNRRIITVSVIQDASPRCLPFLEKM